MLGVGWNFAFISATTLVTECHDPHERNKVQAFNDFLIFGSMAIGSFSSGALLSRYGWSAVNEVVFPVILVAALLLAWGSLVRRPSRYDRRKDSDRKWPKSRPSQGECGKSAKRGRRRASKARRIDAQNLGARPPRQWRSARPRRKQAPRKQTFVANHLNPGAFEGGLRSYAKYRDLDIASATSGLARAHVIKMMPPAIRPWCRSGTITTSNFR